MHVMVCEKIQTLAITNILNCMMLGMQIIPMLRCRKGEYLLDGRTCSNAPILNMFYDLGSSAIQSVFC